MGITNNMLPVQAMPSQAQSMPAPQQPPQYPPIPVDKLNTEHATIDSMIKKSSMLVKKPDLDSNDIINELADLVSDDHLTAQSAMQVLATIPKGKMGEPVTPDVYQSWMKAQLGKLMQHKQDLTKVYGSPIPRDKRDALKAAAMTQGAQNAN